MSKADFAYAGSGCPARAAFSGEVIAWIYLVDVQHGWYVGTAEGQLRWLPAGELTALLAADASARARNSLASRPPAIDAALARGR